MDNDKGEYRWAFLDGEAVCSDDDGTVDNFEALFEQSTQGSFLDNDEVDQGNSLALLTSQLFEQDEQHITALKRKYVTTPGRERNLEIDSLSPRLNAVRISPRAKTSRRRLFDDSGVGNETEDLTATEEVLGGSGSSDIVPSTSSSADSCEELLRANNVYNACLARFKEAFGVGFTDLTRSFKSNKTCSQHWVVTVFGAPETLIEAAKVQLGEQSLFLQHQCSWAGSKRVDLFLFQFKAEKCRLTLTKQVSAMLGVAERLVLAEPPNCRSNLAAFYFYKKTLGKEPYVSFKGSSPEWIVKQVLIEHRVAASETFDFSKMVQWAYDNNYVEESEIAYNYALEAETDSNAESWLKTTSQVKYVKDCAQMVRMYKRQQMREMSNTQWIRKCCNEQEVTGDWKVIAAFLRYQEVNLVMFLSALRNMLKGTPKRHCLVITGPPDTGKSYFCTTLVSFLKGRVISFMNSKSQFWLQPLADAKIGFLDDATHTCWTYMDTYLRNALDGNPVQVDMKHRASIQLKLPPLLITSNIDVMNMDRYRYLHSRLQSFEFTKRMPLDSKGQPEFVLSAANWASFFTRLAKQLGLEEEEDEFSPGSFRCSARTDSQSV
ncbi:E1 [Micromys minutus papillomavirus 1]|uniref:Replication protein E1 n=1 Tax=Micromys minutus papillomavirus TaxID=10568 RepID=A0EPK5_MMPV|nr:E1 [Micromys minutus papillomavirus 1]ABB85354.1 E1 [Micromys minutus papillomavirus 1]